MHCTKHSAWYYVLFHLMYSNSVYSNQYCAMYCVLYQLLYAIPGTVYCIRNCVLHQLPGGQGTKPHKEVVVGIQQHHVLLWKT